ncbi:YopX family protein [Enterococcus innesii]|uniref:YopX family protein n=1 Tax=Enterococcus innesii TaxID=2839759 RepID=UPI00232AE67E|nr:YopX family protein [Enterococcus innesii]MDC0751793.1 YopX family protein [Enterococcus innesii]MDC0775881.1 YopX family protein [Enterococcus innesii]MDC0778859.1 YopX family protein [Enterococcus innesii]MDC0782738.1 YopX family protein [Enterococcus innesii]
MIPKFRAWDKESKSMHQILEIIYSNDLSYISFITIGGGNLIYGPKRRLGDDVIIMQSTGLKDKNGVEIFEGDIVRWHDVVTWDYSVTFKDGVFCISDDPSSNFYHLKEDINGKFEVIGNIYENPELLEQANEK